LDAQKGGDATLKGVQGKFIKTPKKQLLMWKYGIRSVDDWLSTEGKSSWACKALWARGSKGFDEGGIGIAPSSQYGKRRGEYNSSNTSRR